MSEYSIKEQFLIASTWISYIGLVVTGIGFLLWIMSFITKNLSNNDGPLIFNVALLLMEFGILIWLITFFPRIKYFNIIYSSSIFLLSLVLVPVLTSFISPYGVFKLNTLSQLSVFSNTMMFVDIIVLVFLLFKEMNKIYFSKNIVNRILIYFTNNNPESQISWVEFSKKAGFTEKLAELYLRKLVEYNPEFGYYDEENETFKGSNKTIPILENLLLEIKKSPQEEFISAIKHINR